jgi:MYXO-CTERM domain-containing protein
VAFKLSSLLAGVGVCAAVLASSARSSALLACDPDGPTPPPGATHKPSACCAALGAKLLDGAFRDSKGRNGYQLVNDLALGATLIKRGAGIGGCHGTTTDPTSDAYPYTCDAVDGALATTAAYAKRLDFKWIQSDGSSSPGHPAAGMIFDLGGMSNQVAVFPDIDHGPNPHESIEFNVYLSNNPDAVEFVPYKDVIAGKVDPGKWNEAVVLRGYKEGWDVNTKADGVVFVFGLPCGINFRYASIGAGNSGNPAPECTFFDGDNEFDAVLGLQEGGEAVCPDRDKDGYADCACAADKSACDCVDDPAKDPDAAKIHPGAPESCSANKDLNCDGKIGVCPSGSFCRDDACRLPCGSGEFRCSPGSSCDGKTEPGPDGGVVPALCIPAPCGESGFCKAGTYCIKGACVDPCADAKCPFGQKCISGECVDPCLNVRCPEGLLCQQGECIPKCTCLAKSPCKDPTPTCLGLGPKAGLCVAKGCEAVTCGEGQHCEANADGIGTCVSGCDTVVCPLGRVCEDGKCKDPCAGKTCPDGVCFNGECVDPQCVGIVCDPGKVCVGGVCGDPATGAEVCLACGGDAGADASAGDDGFDDGAKVTGGCGCAVPGPRAAGYGLAAAVALAGLAAARRRRR